MQPDCGANSESQAVQRLCVYASFTAGNCSATSDSLFSTDHLTGDLVMQGKHFCTGVQEVFEGQDGI